MGSFVNFFFDYSSNTNSQNLSPLSPSGNFCEELMVISNSKRRNITAFERATTIYRQCSYTITLIFMPPFEKGGHIALHLSVGMSVCRSVCRYVGSP